LQLAAGAAAVPVVSRIARAQTYPARPVRLIVLAAAGNASDILARLMGHWLSERLGRPFVIENRPGAATNIGTEAVVKAPRTAIRSSMSLRPTPLMPALRQAQLQFHP
jgi:tripartite-type tricarboxylate transporter receptor subunit TctC